MKAILKIQKQRDGSVAYLIFPRGKGTVRSFSEKQGTGSRISFFEKNRQISRCPCDVPETRGVSFR